MDTRENVARQLGLSENQVQAVLDLLADGGTIPFIARYRKEQTGSLDEEQLRLIEQAWQYQNNLADRKDSVLALIDEKGLLTAQIKASIEAADTLAAVEDLYRPYKEKRKTKASAAVEAGLQPLADRILEQKVAAESLGSPAELEGAGYIIAEQISDDAAIRKLIREKTEKQGSMCSKKKKDAEDPKGIYQNYYDFSGSLADMPSFRVLALDRGEKEKVLTVSLEADQEALEQLIQKRIIKNDVSRKFLEDVIHDSMQRLIMPSIKREIRSTLRDKACEQAIAGFGSNLEHMLMTRPLKGKTILAWDPGYGHGCKLAVINAQGTLLDTEVVFPFRGDMGTPRQAADEKAAVAVTENLIRRWHPELVVIGNGTASRESEQLVARIIHGHPGMAYVIGSEAGASVYSASELARQEFPDLPVEKRSAISIGRRVQDPLSELVKIDPQSLGIGEYQHDVAQKQLREMLDFVTDKAVNRVGVNVNTASPSLLKHVSGLTKPQIMKILKQREAAPFTSRQQLKDLLPPKAYEQSIGFLRVPEGTDPLDNTGIHPESYGLVKDLLADNGLNINDLRDEDFRSRLRRINPSAAAKKYGSDVYTVADIIKELRNPGLDPRDSLDAPVLKTDVLHIEDLRPGMELQGTVRNVTSFGAFVDIGLHEDGLVHVSRMSKKFVKDPKDVVHAGQIVTVYVVDTDLQRERISLSLLKDKT